MELKKHASFSSVFLVERETEIRWPCEALHSKAPCSGPLKSEIEDFVRKRIIMILSKLRMKYCLYVRSYKNKRTLRLCQTNLTQSESVLNNKLFKLVSFA